MHKRGATRLRGKPPLNPRPVSKDGAWRGRGQNHTSGSARNVELHTGLPMPRPPQACSNLGERGFAQEQAVEGIFVALVPQEAREIVNLALQLFGHGGRFLSINSVMLMAEIIH